MKVTFCGLPSFDDVTCKPRITGCLRLVVDGQNMCYPGPRGFLLIFTCVREPRSGERESRSGSLTRGKMKKNLWDQGKHVPVDQGLTLELIDLPFPVWFLEISSTSLKKKTRLHTNRR